MSSISSPSWREQFGLDNRNAPEFFGDTDDLSYNVPQAHLLQRGFAELDLDGILCTDNTPLVYFCRVDQIDPDWEADFYRDFWHHGGAPVLVVISDDNVNIYSALTLPSVDDTNNGLVTTLDRATDDLAAFLLSVESGEFFHANRRYFDPDQRVDRALLANLRDTRQELNDLSLRDIPESVLDALLCRLVFTAYLFDRGVIGPDYLRSLDIAEGGHLRDILAIKPTGRAKAALYSVFEKLAEDFNGDLFADNLNAEAKWIVNKHLDVLSAFFHGTSVKTGQRVFWPYDFGRIPIETISAIYERFLKEGEKAEGAFYTPRFLAEIVLDVALDGTDELIGKTFLDPACGSGIFLVGLFNRLAQQWRSRNPRARNLTVARELMNLIQKSLFGIDVNPTACRIASFSLYLAYLDHLSPRDIQQLQEKGRALPRLVSDESNSRNIVCADFFDDSEQIPKAASLVVGNPPWGSVAGPETKAGKWAAANDIALPDNQIASAFIRKAPMNTDESGHVCLVLPAGAIFNRSDKAIAFQKDWITSNRLVRLLNLADYQRFLFEVAGYPAIVVRYRPEKPSTSNITTIDYWSPKSDWSVTKAEVIRVAHEDRTTLALDDVVLSLESDDAPQIWKRHFWATPRDRRLLDRLSDLPRLRDQVRQSKEKSVKPWTMAQGFQPLGPSDNPKEAKTIQLDSRTFVEATSKKLDLFLLPDDCVQLEDASVVVRKRSSVNTLVFRSPHVLITHGFSRVAFADFYVSFRHSIRAIHGPVSDSNALAFLAAYLRSDLARFYLFHTSSNWGIERARVLDDELLMLPFPLPPDDLSQNRRGKIIEEVAETVRSAAQRTKRELVDRADVVANVSRKISPLVDEYFGITESERELINDTINIIIPSTRPTRSRLNVPTVKRSSIKQREAYVHRVCDLLNGWSKRGGQGVRGQVVASAESGVGLAIFEKVDRSLINATMPADSVGVVETLRRLREVATRKGVALELIRGVKVFDASRLYVVKPLDQRNWTLTAAMNDADEMAGYILMRRSAQPA